MGTTLRDTWIDWIDGHDWNVFGTLTFAPGHRPRSRDEARRSFRKFWNRMDRLVYGQTGNRIYRAVFEHFGALGDNPHCHFVANYPVDVRLACVATNAIWRSLIEAAAPPSMNEITPIIASDRAILYGLREEWKRDGGTYCPELSHVNDPNTLAHKYAKDRLLAASGNHWFSEAFKAFPEHVKAVQERYERRHR